MLKISGPFVLLFVVFEVLSGQFSSGADITSKTVTVVAGSNAVLPCSSQSKNVMVMWSTQTASASRKQLTIGSLSIGGPRYRVGRPFQTVWDLIIMDASDQNSGLYFCQVLSKAGTKIYSIKLLVVETMDPTTMPVSSTTTQTTEVQQDLTTENKQDLTTETLQSMSTETPQSVSTETPQSVSTETPQSMSTETPQSMSTETPQSMTTEIPQNVTEILQEVAEASFHYHYVMDLGNQLDCMDQSKAEQIKKQILGIVSLER